MVKIGQAIQFIRNDGAVIDLHSPPTRAVTAMSGWGMPEFASHQISGPYQHGTSFVSYRLAPRTINIAINYKGDSRGDWYRERNALLNQLGLNATSANLPVLGTLRWQYLNTAGAIITRDIDCYLNSGLLFTDKDGWREWNIAEPLEFIAPNPVIYDPEVIEEDFTFVEGLVLPASFPIVLGTLIGANTITYEGTWESYPIIEILGPTNGFFIWNFSADVIISMNYNISVGETVTIDLTSSVKVVTNDLGQNLIKYITTDSDMGTFALYNNPILTNGTNIMYAGVYDNSVDTSVTIKYTNKYYGI